MGSKSPHDDKRDGCVPHADLGDAEARAALCRIANLLNALHCGALLIHRDGTIAHVNSRLCDMIQRACHELVGTRAVDLYPPGRGRDRIQNALDHFDSASEQESYLPRADGAELPVILSGRRLDGESPLGDFRIVTLIDISPQKRAEGDLRESTENMAKLSDIVLAQALKLKDHAKHLEERIHERTVELREANMEAIYMLAVASDAKDEDTGAHVRRIEHYSRLLGIELGMSAKEAEQMAYSSILHDVGKIHVPDEVLRKPGPLTDDEWVIMRHHTIAGERILSRKPFFQLARAIARSHHENWDGSGYPDGLKAGRIPLPARIVRIVDVYDALTSVRPYKKAWAPSDAIKEIERHQARSFDPDLVRAFLRVANAGRLIAPDPAEQ